MREREKLYNEESKQEHSRIEFFSQIAPWFKMGGMKASFKLILK